jgi:hypothetical protein
MPQALVALRGRLSARGLMPSSIGLGLGAEKGATKNYAPLRKRPELVASDAQDAQHGAQG